MVSSYSPLIGRHPAESSRHDEAVTLTMPIVAAVPRIVHARKRTASAAYRAIGLDSQVTLMSDGCLWHIISPRKA